MSTVEYIVPVAPCAVILSPDSKLARPRDSLGELSCMLICSPVHTEDSAACNCRAPSRTVIASTTASNIVVKRLSAARYIKRCRISSGHKITRTVCVSSRVDRRTELAVSPCKDRVFWKQIHDRAGACIAEHHVRIAVFGTRSARNKRRFRHRRKYPSAHSTLYKDCLSLGHCKRLSRGYSDWEDYVVICALASTCDSRSRIERRNANIERLSTLQMHIAAANFRYDNIARYDVVTSRNS